ncbi:hypothetical protein COT72_04740 [archaeon CG10_big_fil_rev_8_21_14_0_10_43_11]|nr:MAG: hypothetical protein COT72_04740 [archaeon CG10_big_fil_rev_8_21_14_0_10_43_11]
MALDIVSLVGFVAGFLGTIATVPQVIKTFQTKKADDISLGMYVILTTAIFLWAVYGYLRADAPIAIANSISTLLVGTVLVMKLKYR